ncbi:MAG TPA: hypothetical protein VKS82_12335 [Streptosporangiaceae bacterium]|nr:hypothetical protein [Streptosporangiaceae bacterium]
MTPLTSDPLRVRTTAIGLLSFAAAEEQLLLATAAWSNGNDQGSPDRWAAVPLVAHNTDFRNQQVQRLDAVRTGTVPPAFAEIDHTSAEVYRGYCQPPHTVAEASRQSTQDLIAGLSAISDEDLLDPARNPWLGGRQLWLQIVVRGFWHPTGHLGDYYIGHGQPGRAVAMHNQAVTWARYLNAPDAAQGMASYNLACAQARAGRPDDAYAALSEAIALNSDLLANAARDADLSSLRDHGKLDALLGYG